MKAVHTENERIAKLWRVGRLLIGKTQVELSKELKISQSNISKYESMALEPSASDWYNFCEFVGIDAHKTLSLGYIDGKKKFKHRLFGETLLKLPVKYRRDFLLKIRELIPFRECILAKMGEEAWDSFLDLNKIDDEIFFVYDFQVSMNMFNDLISWCKTRHFDIIEEVKHFSGNTSYCGILNESYARRKKPQELIKSLIEDQSYYHQIFKTEINVTKDRTEFIPRLTLEATQFFEKEILNVFLTHKLNSFKEILNKNSSSPHLFEIFDHNHEISFSVSA